MTAKRESATRRSNERRRGRDNAAHKTGATRKTPRRTADVAPTRPNRMRTGKVSAPTRVTVGEDKVGQSGPQTAPLRRPVDRPTRPTSTSQAKARAKARKAKAPKISRPPLRELLLAWFTSIDLRPRTLAAKVPFVVLIIGALGVGLGLTLWLSTDSAERTYQISTAREQKRLLQQQAEALERDVRQAQSAPALAEAARDQGMIPTRDTAHLVQSPEGNWVVVGAPKPADGVPPPPLNTKLPDVNPAPPPPPVNPLEVPVLMAPRSAQLLPAVPMPVPGPVAVPGAGPSEVPAIGERFGPVAVAIPGAAR
ncbi:MAG: hypothetical protein K2Q25_08480 [Mycobacteriaceae bacterium]|nr:hypothetical protein [Mycobacteriaceae bacterium]